MAYSNNDLNTGQQFSMMPGGRGPTFGSSPNIPNYNNMQSGLLQNLAAQGEGNDTELAHVNPHEAAILKALGGSGDINQSTGLRQYTNDDPLKQLEMDFYKAIGQGYWGDHKGSDLDWDMDQKTTWRYLNSLNEMMGVREDIDEDYSVGMSDWRDRLGLLGETLSNKYQPLERKRRFALGKGGMDFGESVAPDSVMDQKNYEYQTGRAGLDTEKYDLTKGYKSQVWDLISDAKVGRSNMMIQLTNPYYKYQAPTFSQLTEGMDWFDEPESEYHLGTGPYESNFPGSENWWTKQKQIT